MHVLCGKANKTEKHFIVKTYRSIYFKHVCYLFALGGGKLRKKEVGLLLITAILHKRLYYSFAEQILRFKVCNKSVC